MLLTIEGVRQARAANGEAVTIKAISLRQMSNWDHLEALEREDNVLRTLDHPDIPRYLDTFAECRGNEYFYNFVQV